MKKVFAIAVAIALLSLGGIAQANITIDTVTVGDAGNADDTRYETSGYGSVSYNYNIGKYEVTAGQYTEFLNAVAKTERYGLYHATMSRTDYGSGITRSGLSGNYSYSVTPAFVNRPVNYVNYWDACRFANWLNNGQGNGDTETGAYTLTPIGMTNNTITRNANWKWAVSSEDEWYKAAYYKGGSTDAGYWEYPTGTNSVPGRDMTEATNPGNNANYFGDGNPYPIDSGKWTTVVGEFQNSDSAYGTFDQGGNVWEWNEAIIGGISQYRGLRGGSFGSPDGCLQAWDRKGSFTVPSGGNADIGFRVSQFVPEPLSIISLLGGLLGLLGIRRRRDI